MPSSSFTEMDWVERLMKMSPEVPPGRVAASVSVYVFFVPSEEKIAWTSQSPWLTTMPSVGILRYSDSERFV